MYYILGRIGIYNTTMWDPVYDARQRVTVLLVTINIWSQYFLSFRVVT